MTTYSLQQLLPANIYAYAIVFSRVAAAIGLLPGLGDAYVPPRVRLVAALAITILIVPALSPQLPAEPRNFLTFFTQMFGEITVGLFIGLTARIILASLETAGAIIAMQTNLSSALVFNPGANHPETLPASFYGAFAVVMMLVTNTYGLLLQAIADSYNAFTPGTFPPFDDMAQGMVRLVSRTFTLSVELAAPYLILGTLFYVILALIARIMPQLQVFYVAMPLQIMGGLVMLALTVSASVLWFLSAFETTMRNLTFSP
jgi:flagellar biosynthetic protein FliR